MEMERGLAARFDAGPIPSGLGNLTQLAGLNLSDTRLSGERIYTCSFPRLVGALVVVVC